MGKVGVGIITCDRTDMYDICIESIDKSWYDELVVVDDGKKDHPTLKREGKYIQTTGGVGVGKAKNTALKHLLNEGCKYIILMEDDMKFTGNLFKEHVDDYK